MGRGMRLNVFALSLSTYRHSVKNRHDCLPSLIFPDQNNAGRNVM